MGSISPIFWDWVILSREYYYLLTSNNSLAESSRTSQLLSWCSIDNQSSHLSSLFRLRGPGSRLEQAFLQSLQYCRTALRSSWPCPPVSQNTYLISFPTRHWAPFARQHLSLRVWNCKWRKVTQNSRPGCFVNKSWRCLTKSSGSSLQSRRRGRFKKCNRQKPTLR